MTSTLFLECHSPSGLYEQTTLIWHPHWRPWCQCQVPFIPFFPSCLAPVLPHILVECLCPPKIHTEIQSPVRWYQEVGSCFGYSHTTVANTWQTQFKASPIYFDSSFQRVSAHPGRKDMSGKVIPSMKVRTWSCCFSHQGGAESWEWGLERKSGI